jgi:hypothetical protein
MALDEEGASMTGKERQPQRPQSNWLTTWRRLLRTSTFTTLDELQAFLEAQGLHNGDIPTREAFRRGIAKSHRGKFLLTNTPPVLRWCRRCTKCA